MHRQIQPMSGGAIEQGFLFREVDRNRSSYPPMFSANCRLGMARESEWHRRHIDYGKAQFFQDLPQYRFLRLIRDECTTDRRLIRRYSSAANPTLYQLVNADHAGRMAVRSVN
jgi:hypothetical protein